jgi:hypothetical protein
MANFELMLTLAAGDKRDCFGHTLAQIRRRFGDLDRAQFH